MKVYKVEITKEQNEQLLNCGDESLEVLAFFTKESGDYVNNLVLEDAIKTLDIVTGQIKISLLG